MFTQDSLRAAVRAGGVDVDPTFLKQTGSTNVDLHALAEDGAPEWSIVATGRQTEGRGRLGRTWADAPGRSLLFSMLLRPDLPADRAPLLSLLASAVMATTCFAVTRVAVRSKWPNDLLVGDRKVGGILPEARLSGRRVDHVVLGLGLNVSMRDEDFPPEVRPTATSLVLEGARDPDPGKLLTEFLSLFREEYQPSDPEFARHVIGACTAVSATLGRRVRATTLAGQVVEGAAAGIDLKGGLIVDTGTRQAKVAFGEIAHLEGE